MSRHVPVSLLTGPFEKHFVLTHVNAFFLTKKRHTVRVLAIRCRAIQISWVLNMMTTNEPFFLHVESIPDSWTIQWYNLTLNSKSPESSTSS